jgi:hypothetical protein
MLIQEFAVVITPGADTGKFRLFLILPASLSGQIYFLFHSIVF